MQPDRDELRIECILESMNRLEQWFSSIDKGSFSKEKDEMRFDATLMKLVFIGELSSKMTKATQKENPEIPWRQMKDLRNVIAHEYLGVDATQIFLIVTSELPEIKPKLETLLEKIRTF